jgi:hypothetical protein
VDKGLWVFGFWRKSGQGYQTFPCSEPGIPMYSTCICFSQFNSLVVDTRALLTVNYY